MSSAVIQLLVLAAVAVFLILRLRNVLGTREGFEKPPVVPGERPAAQDDGPVFDTHAEFGGRVYLADPAWQPPAIMSWRRTSAVMAARPDRMSDMTLSCLSHRSLARA